MTDGAREAAGTHDRAVERPPRRPSRRGGRRPGESDTRGAILAAARTAFAAHGFDRATIRTIAAQAGVDPALVLHYFGSKQQLFGAALEIPVAPGQVVRRAALAGRDEMGEVVVRAFLASWEAPENRKRLAAMVRSAMTNDAALEMVRDHLGRKVFGPITQALGVDDAELRATLVGSQFIGLAMMRYIAAVEPLASATVSQLVAALAPTVQRYLTGELRTGQGDGAT